MAKAKQSAYLQRITEAEGLVEEIDDTRERLRVEARRLLGVTDDDSEPPPLRVALRAANVGMYPLVVLGVLSIVDTFQGYAFRVLTPEISQTLGISIGTIAVLTAFQFVAIALAPLPIAALAQKPRRAMLCLLTGFGWALATLFTGFVRGTFALGVVLVIDGLTSGSVAVLHQPLLLDSYPPEARVRALSYYNAAGNVGSAGNLLAPLLVALVAGPLKYTWRGVFVIMGVACVAVLPFCLKLRDPGFGRFDTERVRETVHTYHGEDRLAAHDVTLGFFEVTRRLLLIPTIRRLLGAFSVFGMLLIPYYTFLSFYLDDVRGFGPGERGLFFALTSAAGMAALAIFGKRGEALYRRHPGKVVELGGLLLAVGVVLTVVGAVVPPTWLSVTFFALSSAVIAVLSPALNISFLTVVPAEMRPHAGALYGIFLGAVGGVAGAVLLSGITSRYGLTGALVSLVVPGVAGALLLRNCGRFVEPDLDRMIDEVIEAEEIRRLEEAGQKLPTLSCRSINFSYGQVQVLFNVDFTVDSGEMVALLGTNGAGKSTLLRVISGISLPERGTIRYRGQDITYLDPERRGRLGVVQIPGGRGVFNSLTVVENLRSYGYSLGRRRRELDTLMAECFAAFPQLGERRNARAATLSGGEQQMLSLSKALILKPRLLLVDELSLGLAPVVVEQLLEMVREINRKGVSIVLVEQSVSLALDLVDHAYFMERGEMRFDGTSRDLLARDDLLRAVFLEGTAAALSDTRTS